MSKAYDFTKKEMFATLACSLWSDNVTVFTTCK